MDKISLLVISFIFTLACSSEDPTVDVNERVLKSIELDGTDDYIDLGDQGEFNQLTISAWIKTSVNNKRIVSKFGSVWQYELKITSGDQLEFGVGIDGGSFTVVQGGSGLTDNNWHHVAATWDGTNIKLYIDGTLVNSGTASGALVGGTDPLIIGSWGGSYEFFNGLLSEVSIWNTDLSASSILALSNDCKSLDGSEAQLQFLLDFNNSSGASISNLANSSLNGTFSGNTSVSLTTTIPCN